MSEPTEPAQPVDVGGVKFIEVAEFRRLGYLQELNRRFLHPLGLALSVSVDDVTGRETLAGIWDYRDDPEGIVYGEGYGADPEKAAHVDAEWDRFRVQRERLLGFMIQPVES